MWELGTKNSGEQARWVAAADFEARRGQYDRARELYIEGAERRLDYPEYLFDAWRNFEHQYGSLETLETATDAIRRLMVGVATRRQKEYAEAQAAALAQAQPAQAAPAPDAMDVDAPVASTSTGGQKRAAEDQSPEADRTGKRAKTEHVAKTELKRDRENSTVLISRLPAGTTEADLKKFFVDVRSVCLSC